MPTWIHRKKHKHSSNKKSHIKNEKDILKMNIADPKNLWKILKELVSKNEISPFSNICPSKKEGLTFDAFSIFSVSKVLFKSSSQISQKKISKPVDKFGLHCRTYCENIVNFHQNLFKLIEYYLKAFEKH